MANTSLPAIFTILSDRSVAFEVPEGKKALVRGMRAVNQSDDQVTINIYLDVNGESAPLCQKNLPIPGGGMGVDDDDFEMVSGNKIFCDASVGGKVKLTITGEVT